MTRPGHIPTRYLTLFVAESMNEPLFPSFCVLAVDSHYLLFGKSKDLRVITKGKPCDFNDNALNCPASTQVRRLQRKSRHLFRVAKLLPLRRQDTGRGGNNGLYGVNQLGNFLMSLERRDFSKRSGGFDEQGIVSINFISYWLAWWVQPPAAEAPPKSAQRTRCVRNPAPAPPIDTPTTTTPPSNGNVTVPDAPTCKADAPINPGVPRCSD